MAENQLNIVFSHIRHLVGARDCGDSTDTDLLQRFAAQGEEAAFAALMHRHGPMVLRVCRRAANNLEDADEAFQATFLVLIRKANSIRRGESVGSWLHSVAYRVAREARIRAEQQRTRERQAMIPTQSDPSMDAAKRELRRILDEVLDQLPAKYRSPLVLHYLEGKTKEETARQLGWTEGTVSGRLARARDLLRNRLSRRGVALSSAALSAALSQEAAVAGVSAALAGSTVKLVNLLAVGELALGAGTTRVAALAGRVATALFLARLRLVTAVFLIVAAIGVGGSTLLYRTQAKEPPDQHVSLAGAKQENGRQPAAQRTHQHGPPALKQARTDRYGDALPAGALARVGTVRWWHGRDQQGSPMVYSPDGKTLLSCEKNQGIRIVDTATGKELRRLEVKGEPIRCFALSPDGKRLMTGSWSSPVLRQWDVATGKELRQIPTGAKGISVITFAPDGKALAAVTGQTVIRLWDLVTWKETHQLEGHKAWIGSLAFSPDGKTLISGGGITRAMRWWDAGTGREIKRVNVKFEHYWELTLSPDGKRLATLTSPDDVRLWDAKTGDEIGRFPWGEDRGFGCLCFSADSGILACSAGTGRRRQTVFVSAASGRELRRWDEVDSAGRMAFSPDGKILAQAKHGTIQLRDTTTGKTVGKVPLPSLVMSVRFLPDERTLLASCWGGETSAWQPLSGELRSVLRGPPESFAGRADMLLGTALSSDGKKAALVDAKGVLHVWDPATGKVSCRISEPLVGEDQADFSPDGNVLVVKHVDDVIRLWDTVTGKMCRSLPKFGTRRFPHPHAFSPDGRVVAAAPSSQDKSVVRLWDTATGKEVGKLAWQDSTSPTALTFSPAGKYLLTAHEGLDRRGLALKWYARDARVASVGSGNGQGAAAFSYAAARDSRTRNFAGREDLGCWGK